MTNERVESFLVQALVNLQPSKRLLRGSLRCLSERERTILYLRKKGDTLEQVGKKFGVGRERVRQIEVRSLRKVKNFRIPILAPVKNESKLTILGLPSSVQNALRLLLYSRSQSSADISRVRFIHPEYEATLGELISLTEEDILGGRNLGPKSLEQIKQALAQRDLALTTSTKTKESP